MDASAPVREHKDCGVLTSKGGNGVPLGVHSVAAVARR